ncbi:thymidine phosphorylase [bacterium]|nr:MAG: thymidine phosphorylase [bacterium]
MEREEVCFLIDAYIESGKTFDFSHLPTPKIDKHSTGGVGDKTSLILAPAVASCGIRVPMLTGRGLGHTGGTADKLESIPGFRAELSFEEIKRGVEEIGCVMATTTPEIVPADRKIYALRSATGTVDSVPLIVASILSKKLAEGIDGLVLDVKVGRGAFMKTVEDARKLAIELVEAGKLKGLKVVALLTDMNVPLGRAVGNAIEVIEAVDTLKGEGPPDLTEVTHELIKEMLRLGGFSHPETCIDDVFSSGKAYAKFDELVRFQGGRLDELHLPYEPREILADRDGVVEDIDAYLIGLASVYAGAGRLRMEDEVDYGAGIYLMKHLGDEVKKGDTLALLYTRKDPKQPEELIKRAYKIGNKAKERKLIIERIS